MIYFYVKTAFRSIMKNLKTSVVNILGLSIGIATFFVLSLYVIYENSYDTFFENSENIYRIQLNRYKDEALVSEKAMSTYSIGPLMKSNIPEVKNYVRGGFEKCMIYKDGVFFNQQELLWTDSTLLDVLPLSIVKGSKQHVLDEPYTAIISESLSQKLFGESNPINNQFFVNEDIQCTVKAVFKDLPKNSHMNFKLFLSLSTGNDCEKWPTNCGWGTLNSAWDGDSWLYTYVVLQDGANYKEIEEKVARIVNEQLPERFKNQNVKFDFNLQPITDIHLNSKLENEIQPNESKKNVNLILLISILSIVIAWINYINISIAGVYNKAKIMVVKKVNGATNTTVIGHLFVEAFIHNLIATLTAIVLLIIALPLFDLLAAKSLSTFLADHFYLNFILIGLLLAGTIISGISSSILASAFKPVKVFSGKLFSNTDKFTLKKIFVQFQLTVSIILVICVLVIFKQISFMQSKDMGYTEDCILVVDAPLTLNMDNTKPLKFQLLKERLLNYNFVEGVTVKRWGLGEEVLYDFNINRINEEEICEISMSLNQIDQDFTKVMKIPIICGNNFSFDTDANRNKILINETAAKDFGFDPYKDAIGKYLSNNGNRQFQIIGVMKDIHQEALRKNVRPSLFVCNHPQNFGKYIFKLNSKNLKQSIQIIENEWNAIYPNNSFNFCFLDSHIDKLYNSEIRYGQVLTVFSILAIIILCLGLFGLILNTIQKSIKQIGVRKVNGARRLDILIYFAKDYITWNIVAFIIGAPIGLLLMRHWLTGFVYKTELSWWIFVIAGCATMLISLLTISWQSWRAATRNPVEALKYE